jgi:replicative DNA helicase
VIANKKWDSIYVVEAELDAVALYNAGIHNVVAVTTGAKAFKQEWYERLERFKKIYIVYDSDVDGQAGAKKAAKRLGFDRCFNVQLPKTVKDINEYFWDAKERKPRFTLEQFQRLVKDARKFDVQDICSLGDAIKDLHKDKFLADEEELIGLQTPWSRVNKIMGGAKPGQLIVISAPPKIGKTSAVLDWFRFLGQQGITTLMYCCEMREKRLAEKFIAMETKDFLSADELTEMQLAEAHYRLPTDQIYLGYPKTTALDLDPVCERIEQAVKRYGIKAVCFDNLHFLVRGDTVRDKIGEVTRRFKVLAERLGIVFILIVHPRKVGDRVMTADDLKDSSSIYQDLDTLIIIHRRMTAGKNDEENSTGHLDALADIYISGRWCEGGKTVLYFDGKRTRYYDKGSLFDAALQKRIKERERKEREKRGRRVS